MFIFSLILVNLVLAISFFYHMIEDNLGTSIIFLLLIFIVLFFGVQAEQNGYEKGQKQAIKGNVNYEMVIKPDTTFIEK